MADIYNVKFLRGTAASLPAINKDSNTFYFTTDTGALYVGDKLISDGTQLTQAIANIATNTADIVTIKADLEALTGTDFANLESRVTAVETKASANETAIATLNGDENTAGSVKKIAKDAAAEAAAEIVAGADTKYDTLKEIADYIASDTTNAAELSNQVAANKNAIETLNGDENTTGSVAASLKTAKSYADTVAGNALTDAKSYTDDLEDTLGTAAFEDTTAFATAAQGALADTAVQPSDLTVYATKTELANYATNDAVSEALNDKLEATDITTGTANGTIKVSGTDVSVAGLKSAAYVETTAFDAAGSAASAETAAKAYTDQLANDLNTNIDNVIGTSTDSKDTISVYGVRAYAEHQASEAYNDAHTEILALEDVVDDSVKSITTDNQGSITYTTNTGDSTVLKVVTWGSF